MNKGLLIAGTGLALGGGAYLLFGKKRAPVEDLIIPPTELKDHLVKTSASLQAGTSPEQVIGDVAKIVGTSASVVAGTAKLISAGKALLGIKTAATGMVSAAGLPATQANAVVAAAQQAASNTMATGGTAAQASVSAAGVVATALGLAVTVAAVAFMVSVISDLGYDDKGPGWVQEYGKYIYQLTPEQYAAHLEKQTTWRSIMTNAGITTQKPTEEGTYQVAEYKEVAIEGFKKSNPMKRLGFASPTTQLGNIFDDIADFTKKATDTYNAYAPVLDPIRDSAIKSVLKPSASSQPVQQQAKSGSSIPGNSTTSSAGGVSTGAKVAIGIAGAGLIGGVIYAVTRKKKSLGGGSSGSAANNQAQSTVFNGPKRKVKKK